LSHDHVLNLISRIKSWKRRNWWFSKWFHFGC